MNPKIEVKEKGARKALRTLDITRNLSKTRFDYFDSKKKENQIDVYITMLFLLG